MKYCLPVLLLLFLSHFAQAQPAFRAPDGGGQKSFFETVPCLSKAERSRIEQMLAQQSAQLPAPSQTTLPARTTAAVSLAWPLKQAAGFHYYYLYAISNYVDHDARYPNQVLDWNCGNRTYDDASGYNHAGTDIFIWPFSQNMMAAGQAEIVAAAPGVIIGKEDGHPDQSCAMNGGTWNAVYVRHSDSTVAWYGHMKKNSLTTKNIGATVAQGEFLGLVGSSGNSTGPHLHFELHDKNGQVLDPFAGSCSGPVSYWQNQKPYYESVINALMTHSAPPKIMGCPNLDSPFAQDTFSLNDPIYFAAYFHDQRQGQNTVYTITRPDGSVFKTWQYAPPSSYLIAYRYWTDQIPAAGPKGLWQFKARLEGVDYVHPFWVRDAPAGVAPPGSFRGKLCPNPAHQMLRISFAGTARATLRNLLGTAVCTQEGSDLILLNTAPFPDGMYLLELLYRDGHSERSRVLIAH